MCCIGLEYGITYDALNSAFIRIKIISISMFNNPISVIPISTISKYITFISGKCTESLYI